MAAPEKFYRRLISSFLIKLMQQIEQQIDSMTKHFTKGSDLKPNRTRSINKLL